MDNNLLGQFVRQQRGSMSLREFAKRCDNISHTQIDSIEKGYDPRTNKKIKPTVESLMKISKGTGVSVAYLASLASEEADLPREKIPKDLKRILEEEEITLNGRAISAEDKEKIYKVIEVMYWNAKDHNKRS